MTKKKSKAKSKDPDYTIWEDAKPGPELPKESNRPTVQDLVGLVSDNFRELTEQLTPVLRCFPEPCTTNDSEPDFGSTLEQSLQMLNAAIDDVRNRLAL